MSNKNNKSIKKMKVVTDKLNVRMQPSINAKITGKVLKRNTIITVDSISPSGAWAHHNMGGWSSTVYLKEIVTYKPKPKTNLKKISKKVTKANINSNKIKLSNQKNTIYYNVKPGVYHDIKRLPLLFGAPFSFLPTTDNRPPNCDYGRSYIDTIHRDMPILFLKPGLPKFASTLKGKDRNSLLNMLAKSNSSNLSDLLTNKDVRYYTFKEEYESYIKFVNTLCTTMATYLKINNKPYLNGISYGNTDWDKNRMMSKNLAARFSQSFTGVDKNISFCIDGDSDFDDSMSNSTRASVLDSGLKSMSDTVKEAEFLLGAGVGAKIDEASADKYNENVASLSGMKNPTALLSRLKEGVTTIKSGGTMIFPEIYDGSSYPKSYSIDIKLKSPYGDPESVFIHVLVPLAHLLSIVLPRQLGMNGYASPFLVRAYCKGWFNCEMGIIDSFSFKKGGDDSSWTCDTLPSQIDCRLTIKDLYPVMPISMNGSSTITGGSSLFFGNVALLDFLSNLCGLNLSESAIKRQLITMISLLKHKLYNVPDSVYHFIDESLISKARNLFGSRY